VFGERLRWLVGLVGLRVVPVVLQDRLAPSGGCKDKAFLVHALFDAATGQAAQEGTARPDLAEQVPRGPWADEQDLKGTRQTGQ
jgi:hypothetical protein